MWVEWCGFWEERCACTWFVGLDIMLIPPDFTVDINSATMAEAVDIRLLQC